MIEIKTIDFEDFEKMIEEEEYKKNESRSQVAWKNAKNGYGLKQKLHTIVIRDYQNKGGLKWKKMDTGI